jgi:hypothetical protein
MMPKRTAAALHYPHAKTLLVHLLCCIALLVVSPREARSRTDRVNLFPKLQAGQTISYQVTYRSDKQTKTQSSVVLAETPAGAKINVRGLLRMEVLGVVAQGQRAVIHARTWFASLDSDAKPTIPNGQPPADQARKQDPKGIAIEFTIFPDGRVDQVTGLDALSPEQQQAWQQWASRFAAAAVFPQNGVKVAQKWKSQESEKSPSPIAGLSWIRESTYVRNAPCPTVRMTIQGDLVESDQHPETCAVILTTAVLKQQSPAKNTTPDDYGRRQLRTSGTARGNNKTIIYISLKTGLVVRASDEADQTMNVTIAKTDGTNRVHYDIQAKSSAEVLLATNTPRTNP